MGISFGGSLYDWNTGRIIGLFACSFVLWLLFVLQQVFSITTTPEHRLFPVSLISSWEMDILFAQTAAAQDDSALTSGVNLLPFVLVLVFAVMLNGALMGQFGYYMPWYLVGSILALTGSALLYTLTPSTSRARIFGYSVITALGTGMYSQASFPVAQVKAPSTHSFQAVAYIGVGQVGGIALALSISNTIFLNRGTSEIARILPGRERGEIQQAISGVRASFYAELTERQRERVTAAIVGSINEVFIMMIAAAVLSVILAAFMRRERLFMQQG